MSVLDSKIPKGPFETKWSRYKDSLSLVSPANKRKLDIIIVGTGLAGGSAAATLAELGYNVKAFTYHDSPRRAHSVAAQGGCCQRIGKTKFLCFIKIFRALPLYTIT